MLKKPTLLCAYSKSSSFVRSQVTPASSPPIAELPPGILRNNKREGQCASNRRYASVNIDTDTLDWPTPRPSGATPTPYQIFRLKKDEPYSKHRFYKLVKLYHPDKHEHEDCAAACGHLPSAVKMERYRLVIAANDILSDPSKRRAYDAHGTGWKENPGIKVRYERPTGGTTVPWSGFKDNASAFQNATWEDWERWYGKSYKSRQRLKYFSNERFISLIAFASILGAIGHSTQIDHRQANFIDQVHLKSDAAHGQMIRAQEASRGYLSRDQKIHSFLRDREASGLVSEDRESHLKLSPPPGNPERGSTKQ